MPPRHLHRVLARLVLAWFALALGVAAASPLVQPRGGQLVCSASGAVKFLLDDGEGWSEAATPHQLDCALCLLAGAPPPTPVAGPGPEHAAVQALVWPFRVAPAVRHARAPLPARGPPVFS